MLDRTRAPTFQIWWLHNQVNRSLHKPEFPFVNTPRSITYGQLFVLGAVFVHNIYPDPAQYQAAKRLLAALARAGKFDDLATDLATKDIPEALGFRNAEFRTATIKIFGPRY